MENSNVNNLISLWQLAGYKAGDIKLKNGVHISTIPNSDWPNRLWISSEMNVEKLSLIQSIILESDYELKLTLFKDLNQTLKDQLKIKGFELVSKQTGMNLDLNSWMGESQDDMVHLELIRSEQEVEQWSKLFKDSFGYAISVETVGKLKQDMSFYTIFQNDSPAGTAIMYGTGKTAGFHSLGVIPSMRKKGIANSAMVELLFEAKLRGFQKATLQASDLALKMYERLGFTEQFKMLNYQINKK